MGRTEGVISMTNHLKLDVPEPRHPMECSVEDWLAFLGHRWTALILWHLKEAPKRYNELTLLLPNVSQKVLSERLKVLEKRKLIVRSLGNSFPRVVNYELSASGNKLIYILDQLEIWARTREE
jgi:DNA-binding HxlR family transcriptional regulator